MISRCLKILLGLNLLIHSVCSEGEEASVPKKEDELQPPNLDDSGTRPEIKGFGLRGPNSEKPRKKRVNSRRRRRPPQRARSERKSKVKTRGSAIGLGVEVGWEAPYGNGVVGHFILNDLLDLSGGIGYNNSGMKLGAGAHLYITLNQSLSLRLGSSFTNSRGRSGDVSLEAKFRPEGSEISETIESSRGFTVSESLIASPAVGVKWAISSALALIGGGNYNIILSGNELQYEDDIRFNKNIELTNTQDFSEEFDERAKRLVQAGGLGFHLGLMILL